VLISASVGSTRQAKGLGPRISCLNPTSQILPFSFCTAACTALGSTSRVTCRMNWLKVFSRTRHATQADDDPSFA